MRDIRSDLMDRLEEITNRRKQLVEELQILDEREAINRTFLAEEERRWRASESGVLSQSKEKRPRVRLVGLTPVRTFVLEMLADGSPWTMKRLKAAAEGRALFKSGQKPGWVLQGALMGLKKDGAIEAEQGVWKLVNKDAPTDESVEASGNVGVVSGDPLRT